MANRLKQIKSALGMVCFFLTSQTLASYDDISPTFLTRTESQKISGKPIEFETFIVRYATHFPTGSFESTVNVASVSIMRFCNEFNLIGSVCLVELDQNNIEELIQLTSYRKDALANESGMPIDYVDKTLLKVAIDSVNDPYTIMLKSDISSKNPKQAPFVDGSTNSVSQDGHLAKISDFDSDKGCQASHLINKPEKIISLDLRDNIGGDLDCTIKALSGFLPIGKHRIATLFTIDGEEEIWVEGTLTSDNQSEKKSLLVNQETASSAEIFAQNLLNNGWGVRGLPMKGKRSIQAKFDSPYGSYLLTIGRFEIN